MSRRRQFFIMDQVYLREYTIFHSVSCCIERNIGQVRPAVKAIIEREHTVEQPLMVNGILDLNMHPSAKHEGNSRDHKRLCCFCCKSGPISAVIATDK